MNKCIFLDRDGVINKDFVDYAYSLDKFFILDGVEEGLKNLKDAGYLLVIITNQSGIAKGIYTREDMQVCHDYLQDRVGGIIDGIYYSPYHQTITESLSRKPGTLMFEKAISKFNVDVNQSWMIGDKKRDLVPAIKMGLKTIQVDGHDDQMADYVTDDLLSASKYILEQ
ncbi:MAG: HAD-IIIA family hydrolase [bacterium]|nr:HAD-IIIA family hydrolase [bacterium]